MSNIVVYDSGIGGLSVLKCLSTKVPSYDYVYFADNANFPYGDKEEKFLENLAIRNVKFLRDNYDVACVVLACNTITAVAIDKLRSTFSDIIFVGAEPSVKQALDYTVNNIVVATTAVSACNSRLTSRFGAYNVHFVPFPLLATLIENGVPKREIADYIYKILSKQDFAFDCIVLGCTHFVLVRDIFREQAFNCKVFDGNNGVADRVKTLLKRKSKGGCTSVVLSAPNPEKYQQISTIIRNYNC